MWVSSFKRKGVGVQLYYSDRMALEVEEQKAKEILLFLREDYGASIKDSYYEYVYKDIQYKNTLRK